MLKSIDWFRILLKSIVIIGIIVTCLIIALTIGLSADKTFSNQNCMGDKICDTESVTKIVDGDTLYTKSYKIRLSLTNTPEKGKDGFLEATQFTANRCPVGSSIVIDQDDLQPYDKYDRLVGKVFCGDKTLNSELLYNNHANILTSYCKTSEFSNEIWAKEFGC